MISSALRNGQAAVTAAGEAAGVKVGAVVVGLLTVLDGGFDVDGGGAAAGVPPEHAATPVSRQAARIPPRKRMPAI
ncbi:hypothetical protein Amsp01_080180 [Amycolatopsis sp. NBRC 101858]|nr:hypothetical protein Amsp01_080180 [Amycolatopsis sp. NBRC 101858]